MKRISVMRFVVFVSLAAMVLGCNKEQKKTEAAPVEVKDSVVIQEVELVAPEPVKESEWKHPENREGLIQVIQKSREHGLLLSDYYVKQILEKESQFESLDSLSKIDYYALLSKSFSRYYKHMYYGKVNYKELHEDWDVKRAVVLVDTLINHALNNKRVVEVLESAEPKHQSYAMLKDALRYFDSLVGKDGDLIEVNDDIYLMSETPEMIKIKKKLLLWEPKAKIDTTRAEYEQSLVKVVKRFQEKHCIEAKGVINYQTIKALNMSMLERKDQVLANLERWRWYPRNFGSEYMLINIPEYQLYYYRDYKLIRKHKVVVGKKDRQTPVLTSKIGYIVLNPTWTVPETILREDYIPEMVKDNEYLLKKGITIYTQDLKEISPKDWNEKRAFSYKYIQGPGEENVLGKVKFIFANNHFIYLHDTNQKWKFDKVKRNLSSGCMRVDQPIELAMEASTSLMNYMASGKDEEKLVKKNFDTDSEIRILVLYYTAWGTNEGMRYRSDVYDLDDVLHQKITTPLKD